MSKKVLLCYSSGYDSAYLAHKLLTETDYDLTLLTLCSFEEFRSWRASSTHIKKILESTKELAKIRKFNHKYHTVDNSTLTFQTDDWLCYTVSHFSKSINDGEYDCIMSGQTWEQNDGYFFRDLKIKGLSNHIESQKIIKQKRLEGKVVFPLNDETFHKNFGRWHIFKHIPSNLKRHCLPCHLDPPCMRCAKCLYDRKVQQLIDNGISEQEFTKWRQEKNLEYGGGNGRSCAPMLWIRFESDIKIPFTPQPNLLIETKEEFIQWYQTIPYNLPLYLRMKKWNVIDWV